VKTQGGRNSSPENLLLVFVWPCSGGATWVCSAPRRAPPGAWATFTTTAREPTVGAIVGLKNALLLNVGPGAAPPGSRMGRPGRPGCEVQGGLRAGRWGFSANNPPPPLRWGTHGRVRGHPHPPVRFADHGDFKDPGMQSLESGAPIGAGRGPSERPRAPSFWPRASRLSWRVRRRMRVYSRRVGPSHGSHGVCSAPGAAPPLPLAPRWHGQPLAPTSTPGRKWVPLFPIHHQRNSAQNHSI